MTPQQFIAKWQAATLSERSACQQHFLDLCELLGQPKPAAADPEGAWYCFERGVSKLTHDKESGIVNDKSDWCREHNRPRYIIASLARVVRVSIQALQHQKTPRPEPQTLTPKP